MRMTRRLTTMALTTLALTTLGPAALASGGNPHWVSGSGAVTNAVIPQTLNSALGFEVEGIMVLTNSGSVDEGRVPNNPLDHVEDSNSRHPQGVNFLFGDGSVRPIQNSIRPALWVALGTRAGGEPVTPDF